MQDAFKIWLETAQPNDRFTYHTGFSLEQKRTLAVAVWRAWEEGRVCLFQRRVTAIGASDRAMMEWIAIACTVSAWRRINQRRPIRWDAPIEPPVMAVDLLGTRRRAGRPRRELEAVA